jgi:hypothetical protein
MPFTSVDGSASAIAFAQRFIQRLAVRRAALDHPRENVIRRAVQDAVNAFDAVGDHAVADGIDDRHAAADRGFETDRRFVRERGLEQFLAVRGEQRFVRGGRPTCGLQRREQQRARGLDAADDFDENIDFGSVATAIALVVSIGRINIQQRALFSDRARRFCAGKCRGPSCLSAADGCRTESEPRRRPTVPKPSIPTRKFFLVLLSMGHKYYGKLEKVKFKRTLCVADGGISGGPSPGRGAVRRRVMSVRLFPKALTMRAFTLSNGIFFDIA